MSYEVAGGVPESRTHNLVKTYEVSTETGGHVTLKLKRDNLLALNLCTTVEENSQHMDLLRAYKAYLVQLTIPGTQWARGYTVVWSQFDHFVTKYIIPGLRVSDIQF